VADSGERTAEEREAARRERELRRAGHSGQPALAHQPERDQQTAELEEGESDDLSESDGLSENGPGGGEAATDDQLDPEPDRPYSHEPIADPTEPPAEDELGEDVEVPAGTRQVSRLTQLGSDRRQRSRVRTPRKPRADRSGHSSWGRLASLIALVLAAAVIWFLFQLFQPFHGSPHGSVRVTIPADTSSGRVGDLLEREQVISSSFFFQLRATLGGERDDLRPGTYHLQLGMSYGAVLSILTKAPRAAKVTELTITEGRTRHQIDALLRSQRVRGSYFASTRRSSGLNPRHYGAPAHTSSLEGFLFPSTYQLVEPIRIKALVADQLAAFRKNFAKVNLGYARSRHLSAYDVLIIASMVEAEAQTAHDRPLVASVIYNRLKDGMPLQLDATTRYATGNYTKPLTASQLDSSSHYNTRLRKGLTPTPIGNPGLAAIQAAAHPAPTRDLYFVVKPCGNGEQVFTSSYARFLADAHQYQVARAKRGGRSPAHC
jgi:UPF0755 protein